MNEGHHRRDWRRLTSSVSWPQQRCGSVEDELVLSISLEAWDDVQEIDNYEDKPLLKGIEEILDVCDVPIQ